MALTAKKRERRHSRVGASDTPKILGVAPPEFGTIADVYAEKTNPLVADEPTEALAMGHRLEAALLDWAAEQLGIEYDHAHDERVKGTVFIANLDGKIRGNPEAVECKKVGGRYASDWGEAGTDQVPLYVAAQVFHQMYVADLERVHVAALVAGYDLDWRMYVVERDDEIIKQIVEAVLRFWNDHVTPRVPPVDEYGAAIVPRAGTLRKLVRVPDSVARIENKREATKLLRWWNDAYAAERVAKRAKEAMQAAVLHLMGDAEALDVGDSDDRYFTFMPPAKEKQPYTVTPKNKPELRFGKKPQGLLPTGAIEKGNG